MWAVRSRAKREASGLGRKGSWAAGKKERAGRAGLRWVSWAGFWGFSWVLGWIRGKGSGPGRSGFGPDEGERWAAGWVLFGSGLVVGLFFLFYFLFFSFLNLIQTKFEFKYGFEFKPHSNKSMHQHECNTKEIKPMINFNYLRNKIRLNAN